MRKTSSFFMYFAHTQRQPEKGSLLKHCQCLSPFKHVIPIEEFGLATHVTRIFSWQPNLPNLISRRLPAG